MRGQWSQMTALPVLPITPLFFMVLLSLADVDTNVSFGPNI